MHIMCALFKLCGSLFTLLQEMVRRKRCRYVSVPCMRARASWIKIVRSEPAKRGASIAILSKN